MIDHGLSEKTVKKIHEVLAAFPQVERAILFGSRAKGCAKRGSDIDLTLVGHDIDRALLSKLETELDDALLPYTFSLSSHAMLRDPDFLAHIARVGVVFFERSADAA